MNTNTAKAVNAELFLEVLPDEPCFNNFSRFHPIKKNITSANRESKDNMTILSKLHLVLLNDSVKDFMENLSMKSKM